MSVVGNSGSGKTTLAKELARRLSAPYLELDAIFHQPGWTQLPVEQFRARVTEFVTGPAWVVDGNYSAVRDLVWERADTVVWIDLPRHVVMRRLVRRTLGRALLRRELWNGNRERWVNILSRHPDRSILAWGWTMHRKYRDRYANAVNDDAYVHLTFLAVRGRRDYEALLEEAGNLPHRTETQ